MFSFKELLLSVWQSVKVYNVKVLLFFHPEERPETFEFVFSGVPAR